jgi:hypothetical protein
MIQNQSIVIKMSNFIEKLFKRIPVFEPESFSHNVSWCLLIIISKMFFLTLIPVEIAFNNNLVSLTMFPFTLLFMIINLIDILIKFNTGFLHFGKFNTNRFSIFWRNVSQGVITDLFVHLVVFLFILDDYRTASETDRTSDRTWTYYVTLLYF